MHGDSDRKNHYVLGKKSGSETERRDQLRAREGKKVRIIGISRRREEETYWDLELGKSGNGIRGRVLVGVVVSDVLTPLGPRLGFRRGFALLPRAGEVGKRVGRPIQVGIVIPDVGTPFSPSPRFGGGITLLPRTREVRKRVRRSILVGVVVPNAGTPLSPGLGLTLGPGSGVVITDGLSPLGPSQRFGGRIALLPGARKVGERIRRSVLVGVVVTDVGTPLGPSLRFGGGFAFLPRTREVRK